MSAAKKQPLRFRHFVTAADWKNTVSIVAVVPFEAPDRRWPNEVVVLDAKDPRVMAFLAKHAGK